MDDDQVVRLVSIGTPVDKYAVASITWTNLRKPILFVHGDSDEFGSVDSLKKLVDRVSKVTETKLVIFENCGHFFDNHLDELRNTIKDWVIEQTS